MKNLLAEWQKIMMESKMLKEYATSGHWTNFLSLSDTRLKHMRQFFSEFDVTENSDCARKVSEDILKIREDDKVIQDLLATKQESLSSDLLPLQTGMRLIEQYRQHT